jgi:hypothetical protein
VGCSTQAADGVRHCEAGLDGAGSGSWTVQGCAGYTCVEVGRFDAP